MQKISYDVDVFERYVAQKEPMLFKDKNLAYNTIFDSVRFRKSRLIFMDKSGEIGKAFITKLLRANLWQKKGIALAVASRELLQPSAVVGQRTPPWSWQLIWLDSVTCNFNKAQAKSDVLKMCELLV